MKVRGSYQVKELAEAAGVTVRTLHHYDAIGLLVPSGRTEAGYRLYTDADALRLQQILIGRELGLSLEDIRRMLDDPSFDRREALLRQRAELVQRGQRVERMIRAIDAALAASTQDPLAPLTEETAMSLKDILDGFDPSQYEEEAQQRWGDTDAYAESTRRAKKYTAEDWKRYRAESDAIMRDAAAALAAGKRPDDPDVMDVAERHRLSIDQWFYPCSKEMHRNLADMYEADERFAANIDGYAANLTPFLSAAIRANAAR